MYICRRALLYTPIHKTNHYLYRRSRHRKVSARENNSTRNLESGTGDMRDYYAILRISRSATSAEIKSAYRQIALAVHPDVSAPGDQEAAEKFKDVSEAYSVLSDDEQRRIYDRTLGIRKLNYPAQRWKDAARKAKAERPLYTAQPPPGFTPINEEVWKAWHYGVNATAEDPIKQTGGGWMDLEPGNPHQEYFKRQREKESETLGVGRGHRYNTNREKIHLIERVRLRREARLKREAEERSKTTAGREKEEEAAEICSIS